jgi:hypothetical protein
MGATGSIAALLFFLADLAVLAKLGLPIPYGAPLELGLLALLALGAVTSLAGIALDAPWGWRVATAVFAGSIFDFALLFLQTGPSLLFAAGLGASIVGLIIAAVAINPPAPKPDWRPPPPNVKVYYSQRPLHSFDERTPRVVVDEPPI